MAVALAAAFLLLVYVVDRGSPWQLAAVLLALFAVVAVIFDLWVYRPVNGLIRRSRKRLGGNYERNDPFYRDEVKELGYLVGTLIAVFTASRTRSGCRRASRTTWCACSRSTASSWTSVCWGAR